MRRRRDESGVYAILYTLLVLVILGGAATVVDLALMREGRATTRSAADSAVVAAASALNPLDPSKTDPHKACLTAWMYLRTGIDDLGDGSASCATFPTPPPVTCTDATSPKVAAWSGGGYTVRITWPVPASSALMTQPDVAPGSVTQSADPLFDGTDPCDRIAVEVERASATVFASVLGVGQVSIGASSVGRAIERGESKDVIAALNILEQTECGALDASGRGSVVVAGVGDQAGYIAVESDGRSPGNTCKGSPQETSGNQKATIVASSNDIGFIRADGPDGPGTGLIQAYALNPPPTGDPSMAFNSGMITPQPTRLTDRYGAKPVLDIFNCTTASCAPAGDDFVDQLENMYSGSGAPASVWPASPVSTPFQTLPGPLLPAFTCNGAGTDVVVPKGNWFVDCPGPVGLLVSRVLVFQGGHVVTRGPVTVGSDGCLAVNVPVAGATCPTPNLAADPDTTVPSPHGDAILFIRSGDLTKAGGSAELYMPQTFTLLQSGRTNLGGGDGEGALMMTTPLADAPSCVDDTCRNMHFRRLVLWSESTTNHVITGQGALSLRGVLFTPNATSDLNGQAGQQQADAQFWTRKLRVGGQGMLVMAADPEASIARPLLGVSLIR